MPKARVPNLPKTLMRQRVRSQHGARHGVAGLTTDSPLVQVNGASLPTWSRMDGYPDLRHRNLRRRPGPLHGRRLWRRRTKCMRRCSRVSHPAAQQAMAPPPMASHWAMLPLAHPVYMQQPPVQQPAAPMADPEKIKASEKKIESLEESLEAAEAKLTRQADSFEQRLGKMEGIAQEVDELRISTNHDAEPNYSTAPVECAVMRLLERLQRIEDAVVPDEPGGGFFTRLFGRR